MKIFSKVQVKLLVALVICIRLIFLVCLDANAAFLLVQKLSSCQYYLYSYTL